MCGCNCEHVCVEISLASFVGYIRNGEENSWRIPPAVSLWEREGLQSVSHASVFFKQMRPQRERSHSLYAGRSKSRILPENITDSATHTTPGDGISLKSGLTHCELGQCANADYSVLFPIVQYKLNMYFCRSDEPLLQTSVVLNQKCYYTGCKHVYAYI